MAHAHRVRLAPDVEDHEAKDLMQVDGHSSWKHKGNSVAMKKIVDLHYAKVLQDQTLAPFFVGIDMGALKRQQEQLMTLAFGGSDLVQEENPEFDLRALHMRLLIEGGMNLAHWEAFVKHFEETVYSLSEIPQQQQQSAIAWLHSTRHAFRPAEPQEIEAFKAQKTGKAPAKCPFN